MGNLPEIKNRVSCIVCNTVTIKKEPNRRGSSSQAIQFSQYLTGVI